MRCKKYSNELSELRCKAYDDRRDDERLNNESETKIRIEVEKDFSIKLEKSKEEWRDIGSHAEPVSLYCLLSE